MCRTNVVLALKIGYLFICFVLLGIQSSAAQEEDKKYAWEGYWGPKSKLCYNNEYNARPFGFFSSRVENWEHNCTVSGVTKAPNLTEFDKLHLQCTGKNGEQFSQDMRLKLLAEDKLHLLWPGGIGFHLERCDTKPISFRTKRK